MKPYLARSAAAFGSTKYFENHFTLSNEVMDKDQLFSEVRI